MSTPVIMALIVIACIIICFLFIELLKHLSSHDSGPAVIVEEKDGLSIQFLKFPKAIEEMDGFTISSIVRKVYDVYVKFDYHNATEDKLEEKEWHTWQVSMLLKLYKNNQEFYIQDQEKVFHKSILDLKLKSLESLAQSLVVKYNASVNISKTKDELCKEFIWTTREVSVLFYYLSQYRQL